MCNENIHLVCIQCCLVVRIFYRVRGIFKLLGMEDFQRVHLQVIGAEDSFGAHKAAGDVSILSLSIILVLIWP